MMALRNIQIREAYQKRKLGHVPPPTQVDDPSATERPPYDYEVYEGGGLEMAQEHLPLVQE